MYTQTHTRIRFFSSGACHNRLAGHYSDDGACINHNTGSPVKQVSRGCWREHAAMAARAMTNESDTIVDTRKNKHVPQNMGKKLQPKELINIYYGIQLGVRFDILSVNFLYTYYGFFWRFHENRVYRVCASHNFGLFPSAAYA